MRYERFVDQDLDALFPHLAAMSLEGPKGVGKTATASQRASTVLRLDDEAARELVEADPGLLARSAAPVLVDEWQRYPAVWDLVRREVDRDSTGGRFLLTGSAAPTEFPVHSGAGRIVTLRMRPLALAERGRETPTVALRDLFRGDATITGESTLSLPDYVDEILRSGFPGIRDLPPRARRIQLDGYLSRVVERDFPEQGLTVRRPATLRAWLGAYAAATASTATYSTILDAATAGVNDKPSKITTARYRDVLEQLWLLDDVPAWLPQGNELGRLGTVPKHFLADPALAARLLQIDEGRLMSAETPAVLGPQHGTLLGRLFESLIALSLHTYAQTSDAKLFHYRDRNGRREIDFVMIDDDRRIVAAEVKLARSVTDRDVRHLLWLKQTLGDEVRDLVVIYTGEHAYRRRDGVAVIPAALLSA